MELYQWAVYRAAEYEEVSNETYLGDVVSDTMETALTLASQRYGLDVWSLWVVQDQEIEADELEFVETNPQMEVVRVGANKISSPVAEESKGDTNIFGHFSDILRNALKSRRCANMHCTVRSLESP